MEVWKYTLVVTKRSPPNRATKRINKEINKYSFIVCINLWLLYNRFLAFPPGPGGFRELREAYRNHFHLSWYLSEYVVTSYGQKP